MLPPGSVAVTRLLQVTDLIRILVNAPVSTVLIVAGIALLTVAILGTIDRWGIELGDWGRKYGLMIGSVVLLLGVGLHVGMPVDDGGGPSDGTPAPASTPTPTLTPVTAPASPTPAPPTEPPTPAPSLASFSFPEGFAASGFTDPDRAVDGHLRAVSLQSFQATLRYRSDRSTLRFDISADPETRRVHNIWHENGSVQSELYYDAGAVQIRTPGSGGFERGDAVSFAAATLVEGQFDRFFYSTLSDPEALRTQNRPAVSYVVTSERDDHEGDLTVLENGLFLDYSLRIERDSGEVFMQYHVTNLGNTTVETPAWAA
jgi:hypothetical protein